MPHYKVMTNKQYDSLSILFKMLQNGSIDKAHKLWHNELKIGNHNNQLWTSMMTAYVKNKRFNHALHLYDEIRDHPSLTHNQSTYLNALKASTHLKRLHKGQTIHQHIINHTNGMQHNLHHDIKIQCALINMYGKCGDICHAEQVWENVSSETKTIPIYGAMMNAYAKSTHHTMNVLRLFDEIRQNPLLEMDDGIYLLAISACSNTMNLNKGRFIHQLMASKKGKSLDDNLKLQTALITFYGNCQCMEEAESVWNKIKYEHHTEHTYGSWMDALIHCTQFDKALEVYKHMKIHSKTKHECSCNDITYLCAIKTINNLHCSDDDRYREAKAMHQDIMDDTIYCKDIKLHNALMNMYGRCNAIKDAQMLWDSRKDKNAITYGTIMDIHIKSQNYEQVLALFDEIHGRNDLKINRIIALHAVHACAELQLLNKMKRIHEMIMNDTDEKLNNALIHGYGQCNDIQSAQSVFNSMTKSDRTVITYSSMMKAMEHNGLYLNVIQLFERIKTETDIELDDVCYLIALNACTKDPELYNYGIQIKHELDQYKPHMLLCYQIQTQILIMFGSIGDVFAAENMFTTEICNEVKMKEVSVWNAMIQVYGRHGRATDALDLYREMQTMYGINGDDITTIVLLNALSHNGLVDDAKQIFDERAIINDANGTEIYATMTDCYARRGYLAEAYALILQYEEQGNEPNKVMWISLLNGCRMYNDEAMSHKVSMCFKERFKGNSMDIDASVHLLSEATNLYM